jgi:hypothetical protein
MATYNYNLRNAVFNQVGGNQVSIVPGTRPTAQMSLGSYNGCIFAAERYYNEVNNVPVRLIHSVVFFILPFAHQALTHETGNQSIQRLR